jgi:hypothetical protein
VPAVSLRDNYLCMKVTAPAIVAELFFLLWK